MLKRRTQMSHVCARAIAKCDMIHMRPVSSGGGGISRRTIGREPPTILWEDLMVKCLRQRWLIDFLAQNWFQREFYQILDPRPNPGDFRRTIRSTSVIFVTRLDNKTFKNWILGNVASNRQKKSILKRFLRAGRRIFNSRLSSWDPSLPKLQKIQFSRHSERLWVSFLEISPPKPVRNGTEIDFQRFSERRSTSFRCQAQNLTKDPPEIEKNQLVWPFRTALGESLPEKFARKEEEIDLEAFSEGIFTNWGLNGLKTSKNC